MAEQISQVLKQSLLLSRSLLACLFGSVSGMPILENLIGPQTLSSVG